jgi:hypothetical protein
VTDRASPQFGDGSACPFQSAGLSHANSSFQSEAWLGATRQSRRLLTWPAALLSLNEPSMSTFGSEADIVESAS